MKIPILKMLSGLALNFGSAWYILVFVTPLAQVLTSDSIFILIKDLFFGTLNLTLMVFVEKLLQDEQ